MTTTDSDPTTPTRAESPDDGGNLGVASPDATVELSVATTDEPDDRTVTPPVDGGRHRRDNFFVVGEGMWTLDPHGRSVCRAPSTDEDLRAFRFSRLGDEGQPTPRHVLAAVARAMTASGPQRDSDEAIPAGFTYLGQFVDHDLTLDRTKAALGDDVTLDELVQGRSPALDLDSVYGRGPRHERGTYAADGVHLRVGTTQGVGFPAPDPVVQNDLDGFDLPRAGLGAGGTLADQRTPLIPDARNDENLVVAQTHAAFIRFHNRVVDDLAATTPGALLLERARREVVLHYQWMLRSDFLPRIVDPAIVDDVFTCGRRFVDVPGGGHRRYPSGSPDTPTMPLEFSVAAYRLGHSMIRGAYQWNRVFESQGPGGIATLLQLFTFTGISGNFQPNSTVKDLDNPTSGTGLRLPTNWIADFRRLYDFSPLGRDDLLIESGRANVTKRIDTLMVDPLSGLPAGTFDGRGTGVEPIERNLAFRNLLRANMVRLASGQQMAELMRVEALTPDQVLRGNGGGLDLTQVAELSERERAAFAKNTPLWFYILREAELQGGVLAGVGGRIVAEVFHRAMQGSHHSIVRDPYWRPRFGPRDTFRMIDLLLFAFEQRAELLNPLGPTPAVAANVPG
jgi:hypothetical protein